MRSSLLIYDTFRLRVKSGTTSIFPFDPYTLEELRRAYLRADARGRIRLLKKLSPQYWEPGGPHMPYEIALMAVEDDLVEVRGWMARHGKNLDYREQHYSEGQRNLLERLKQDPDPLLVLAYGRIQNCLRALFLEGPKNASSGFMNRII